MIFDDEKTVKLDGMHPLDAWSIVAALVSAVGFVLLILEFKK